ncbi:hypothetical protein GOP47_0014306 [Adiantum capillus-veneris]|uniref:Macro domain-containing protein n=1 Tax=Adiantum capillus-veneris TaxID=13818 RepID=A0A9D4UMC6_ADICA|nr:hypothetical protein GOP47_0014306 [Adiantum capillus-veneris]
MSPDSMTWRAIIGLSGAKRTRLCAAKTTALAHSTRLNKQTNGTCVQPLPTMEAFQSSHAKGIGDITKWSIDGKTDAIVNAANTRMLGGGGVDGAIHRAAGSALYDACLELPLVGKNIRCRTGDAVITKGFRLPVSKIIHTVGPVYDNDEKSGPLLESSYKSSLVLAEKSGVKYLAFPAISCGIYGYPYDKAAEIALDTVSKYSSGMKEVHFVLFEEGSWVEWLERASKSFGRLEEEL